MPDADFDKELIEGLRQAKTKPRNFAIIVKGAKVLKLIVKKKPIKPAEVQEAKTEVKGTGYYQGVCQGEGGAEMVFSLVGEEPSVKATQFKELIAEQTGLTIKPRFAVVTELQEVNDDSPESGAPQETPSSSGGPPQVNELAPPPAPPPPPKDLSAEAKALMAALNKLATPIKDAVASNPARRNDIVGLVAKFKKELGEEQLAVATESLKSLATLLKELGPKPQSPEQSVVQSPSEQPQQPKQSQQPSANPLEGRWNQEYPPVHTQYLEALKKADSKLASQLKVVYTYATEQAEALAYDRALQGLQRLAPLIAQALAVVGQGGASSEIASGIVEKRKFLASRWDQIPKEVASDLNALKTAISQSVPDENPDELVARINEYLKDFWSDMRDEIDKAINSGDSTYKSAITAIKDFKAEVGQNPMVQHLERNKVGADLSVEGILMSALQEVQDNLAG